MGILKTIQIVTYLAGRCVCSCMQTLWQVKIAVLSCHYIFLSWCLFFFFFWVFERFNSLSCICIALFIAQRCGSAIRKAHSCCVTNQNFYHAALPSEYENVNIKREAVFRRIDKAGPSQKLMLRWHGEHFGSRLGQERCSQVAGGLSICCVRARW